MRHDSFCATGRAALAPDLHFSGTGSVLPAGRPDAVGDRSLQVRSLLTSYDFGIGHACRLHARFVTHLGTGEGEGAFVVHTRSGSFAGEFTAQALPVGRFGGFDVTSTVLGGTGDFAGVRGEGLSVVTLLGPPTAFPMPYAEAGRWRLDRRCDGLPSAIRRPSVSLQRAASGSPWMSRE